MKINNWKCVVYILAHIKGVKWFGHILADSKYTHVSGECERARVRIQLMNKWLNSPVAGFKFTRKITVKLLKTPVSHLHIINHTVVLTVYATVMSTWHSAPCVCHRWIYQRPAKITISIIYANYSVPVHLMHFPVFYVRAFFLFIRFNFHCRHQTSEDITKKSDELSTAAIVYFEYNYMVNGGKYFFLLQNTILFIQIIISLLRCRQP